MARTLEEVLHDALQLSFEERAQLIEHLRDSTMSPEEREIEQAWLEEAERRLREFEAGTAKTIPGEEVLRKLREKYGSAKSTWTAEANRRYERLKSGEDAGLSVEEFWSDEED